MKNFTFFFLLLFNQHIIGQNLIFNGGFEIIDTCPSVFAPIDHAIGWKTVSHKLLHPILYNLCTNPDEFIGTFPGRKSPRTGNSYAQIAAGEFDSFQTKLLSKLEKDRQYIVKFYIKHEKATYDALTPIYAILSKYSNYDSIVKFSDMEAQVKIDNYGLLKNSNDWIKVEGIYTAKGNEEFLTITYLNRGMQKWPFCECYHYFDDISVYPLLREPETQQTIVEKDTMSFKAGDIIKLENINFEYNKSVLLSNSFPILNKLLDYLISNEEASILINGHTDNSGLEMHNLILSKERAKSVYDYLLGKGINKSRMKFIGYGSSKPLNDNSTEEERMRNRRVEIELLIKNKL